MPAVRPASACLPCSAISSASPRRIPLLGLAARPATLPVVGGKKDGNPRGPKQTTLRRAVQEKASWPASSVACPTRVNQQRKKVKQISCLWPDRLGQNYTAHGRISICFKNDEEVPVVKCNVKPQQERRL